MVKHNKRIFSILLAILLFVLSSTFAASAAELLDTSRKVSLNLNCLKPGYTFTVYNVATLDHTSTSPFETAYNSLIPEISDKILSGKTADILVALDEIETIPQTATVVGTFESSAISTSKTINNLAQGMYYVRATNFPAGVKSVTNSVVALPYYNNSWIYSIDDISLAEKVVDDVPETHKSITNSTKDNENYTDVSLGDTVNFEIRSTTAGSKSMKLGSYVIYDEMSAGLTLNKESFNVALLKQDGTKITDLDSNEYTVNITSESEGNNTVFNVALTHEYLQGDEFYDSDVYYTSVTYSAVLNKAAIVGTAGNPNTEQKLEYSNKNGVTADVEGNTVYVYTYAVKTNKFDESGNALEGAKFALYTTKENAEAQENEIATGTSDSQGLVLYYNSDGEEIRLQSGTYYIVEFEAPDGYNLYGKVIEIIINAEYGDTFINGTYVTNCPADGYASVDVKDTEIILPQTGGNGATIVYVIGAVSFLIGISILYIYRKLKNKSAKA